MSAQQVTTSTPESITRRKEIKRQRREAQIATRTRIESQERRKRLLLWGGIAFVTVAAFVALGYWLFGPTGGPQIQSIPIQGRTHIQRGQAHPPYNSLPPTSGWHYGDAVAPWGVSRDPILDQVQVHNLEHGGIMIQYDCPQGCPEIISQLESIGRSYPSKVIVAPYYGLAESGHPIALTAWGKLAYLDEVNEPFIRSFIARFKDKGPEYVPD